MNPVIPVWAGSAAGSVFASSITIPERQPFVTQSFCPEMTYSSPSRTAVVRIDWTSEPACGSVIENEARSSIEASFGRKRSRCSSVPWSRIIVAAMNDPLRIPESVTQPRESSITISAYVSSPSPSPPCSSGIVVPKSPISRIVSTSDSGYSSACSSVGGDRDDVAVDELADGGDDLRLLGRDRHAGTASREGERRQRRGDVRLLVEREQRVLETLDRVVGERERRVLAELLPHLVGRERVLRATLLMRVVGVEGRPVGEPHLDAAGERLRVRRVVARLVAHLLGDGEHRRVGDRLVREVLDRDVTADEERGDGVLERELPLVLRARAPLLGRRLEHERDARFRDGDEDVLDLVGREGAPRRALRRGAEGAVHEVADGERLVGDPRRLPAAAEVGELAGDVDLALLGVEERVVEAELPLEHRARACRAVRREPRREVRPVRRPGRMHRLRRCSLGQVRKEPARERAGNAERARRDRGVEPGHARDRGDAAEDPADRRRVEAARVECPRRGHADAAHDLVARDDGRERVASARAGLLGGGERRRRDHRRDVADRLRVRVVVVEPVAEHRVREGGVRRREASLGAEHGRLRLPAELRHRRAALVRDSGRVRGEPAPDGVEHVELRVLPNDRGDVVEAERDRPVGDRASSRHTVHSSLVAGKPSAISGAPRR